MTRPLVPAFALALATSACGDDAEDPVADDGTTGDANDDDDDADDDDDDGSTTAPDPTDADTSTAAAESTGAGPVDLPAQGIAVDFVEINQGVSVRIGADGASVGPTERTAPVIARRNALVRAFYTLEP